VFFRGVCRAWFLIYHVPPFLGVLAISETSKRRHMGAELFLAMLSAAVYL
jgi:hypothetical protein